MSDDDDGPDDPVNLDPSLGDTGGVDAGWGTDSTDEEQTDGLSTSRTASESRPTDRGLTVDEVIPEIPANRLDGVLSETQIPGEYDDRPYLLARVGKSKTSWDRDHEVRVSVFDEVGAHLNAVHEYFDETVYPETNVLKADVTMAALLVGVYNLDQMEALLDFWGYSEMG
jgi:hypothetical protein